MAKHEIAPETRQDPEREQTGERVRAPKEEYVTAAQVLDPLITEIILFDEG